MANFVKTLYKVKMQKDDDYMVWGGRDEIIFEMRSVQTALAFERLLRRARLHIVKIKPHERTRNPLAHKRLLKD